MLQAIRLEDALKRFFGRRVLASTRTPNLDALGGGDAAAIADVIEEFTEQLECWVSETEYRPSEEQPGGAKWLLTVAVGCLRSHSGHLRDPSQTDLRQWDLIASLIVVITGLLEHVETRKCEEYRPQLVRVRRYLSEFEIVDPHVPFPMGEDSGNS